MISAKEAHDIYCSKLPESEQEDLVMIDYAIRRCANAGKCCTIIRRDFGDELSRNVTLTLHDLGHKVKHTTIFGLNGCVEYNEYIISWDNVNE